MRSYSFPFYFEMINFRDKICVQKPLLLCVAFLAFLQQALTFDVRGGYRAGSHSYESRYKVSQGWETGWWASMEMDNKNNKNNHQGNQGTDRADGSHSFGDSTVDYNEIEVNHSPINGPCSLAASITGAAKALSYGLICALIIKPRPTLPLGCVIAMTTTLMKRSIVPVSRIGIASIVWIYMLPINLMHNGAPYIKARSIATSMTTISIKMISLRRQKMR